MIDCDGRPGHPLDRTVCGDRRSCGPAPAGPGPAAEADRCGTGVPGTGAGAARLRQRAPVDPVRLLPARSPVPLPAGPARLPQAAESGGAAARPGDQPPGPVQPIVVRLAAADRRHPVPGAASRQTVCRSDLAGYGGYGFCAAHSRWYWGLKLYLLCAPDGMPITRCLADPKIGEREVCLDLLTIAVETGLLAPGTTVLADKNLAGRDIEGQITRLGVRLLRPDRRDEPHRHGSLGGCRQWVESVYDSLKRGYGWDRTRLDGRQGAAIWCGHGVFAH